MTSYAAKPKTQSIEHICHSAEFRELVERTCDQYASLIDVDVADELMELVSPSISLVAAHIANESDAPVAECAGRLEHLIRQEITSTNWGSSATFVRVSLQRRMTLQIAKVRGGIRHTRALACSF